MDFDQYLQRPLVRGYQTYLKLERSVSPNTLQAYLKDLAKWLSYLDDAHIDCLDAKLEH
ncbi:MAG: site-specific integrase, partial [Paludibacteraceae bacterium]|nr:site-specific integrase [Paludibacteraceae bacterium]